MRDESAKRIRMQEKQLVAGKPDDRDGNDQLSLAFRASAAEAPSRLPTDKENAERWRLCQRSVKSKFSFSIYLLTASAREELNLKYAGRLACIVGTVVLGGIAGFILSDHRRRAIRHSASPPVEKLTHELEKAWAPYHTRNKCDLNTVIAEVSARHCPFGELGSGGWVA
jgi:hypothetical protein